MARLERLEGRKKIAVKFRHLIPVQNTVRGLVPGQEANEFHGALRVGNIRNFSGGLESLRATARLDLPTAQLRHSRTL